MNRKYVSLLLLIGILFLSSQAVWAQAGGDFEIDKSTIDGGGGQSSGGGFTMEGTIGQPDAGIHTGGNFTLNGGFWTNVSCTAPMTVGVTQAGGNVTLSWSGGTYNVFRAIDDPYFTSGTQIGTGESSGWVYAEALLGNPAQNAYYVIGSATACGKRVGEFDFAIVAGTP